MKVQFVKNHPDAVLPKPVHAGDVGYDLVSVEDKIIRWNPIEQNDNVVDVGIELAYIDPGYWFLILPRSGLGFKYGIQNHIGTIDAGYRGIIYVKLYLLSPTTDEYTVKKGDKIAQMAFFPILSPEIEWADKKIESSRGTGGLGSTGR